MRRILLLAMPALLAGCGALTPIDELTWSTQLARTLPLEEQKALHGFLADLVQGRTLVLLGSRGSEDWLAKQTFDKNIYDLPGLDDEAATTLADRILERNNATKYRLDPDLRQLLKLLEGVRAGQRRGNTPIDSALMDDGPPASPTDE